MTQITQITRRYGVPVSVNFDNGVIRHYDTARAMWIASERETELILEAVEELREKPYYYRRDNVGRAKYTITHYDGLKQHSDGSERCEVAIFKSLKKLNEFTRDLDRKGYEQR